MLQSSQHNLFTGLLDLARKEDLIEYCIDLFVPLYQPSYLPSTPSPNGPFPKAEPTYLIKVKHQIQLADVPKETIQHLDKEMYSL